MERRRASLTNTLSDPLAKFLFPVPMTLCSAGLEVFVSKGGMLPPGDITMIPLNWMLRLLSSHFGLLVPQNQWAEKGVTVLAGALTTKGKFNNYSTRELRKSKFRVSLSTIMSCG